MNAPVSILPASQRPTLPGDAFALWRGTFLQHFAAIERDAYALLDRLSAADDKTSGAASFGACLNALQKAAEGRPKGKALRSTIAKLAALRFHRNAIVHGHGQVCTDPDGRWVWCFAHRCDSNGQDVRGWLDSGEAADLFVSVRRLSQSLKDLANQPANPASSPAAPAAKT